jgi:hypothetical protein
MTETEAALVEHIKSLDKELEDIYNKLGFFRKNKCYAEKQDRREEQTPEKQ